MDNYYSLNIKRIYTALCVLFIPFFASLAQSGQCGSGVFWKIKQTSFVYEDFVLHTNINDARYVSYNSVRYHFSGETLVIYGKGEMDTPIPKQYTHSAVRIIVSDGVTSICDDAFVGAVNLVRADLAQSVWKIGCRAFRGCMSLKSIKLPSNDLVICDAAFSNCGLFEIEIPYHPDIKDPDTNTRIIWDYSWGDSIFSNCESLRTVKLPKNMITLPERTFQGCVNLKYIDLSNLVSIGKYAFKGCKKLLNVDMPKPSAEPLEIGVGAFMECEQLSMIDLSSFESVPDSLCLGCFRLSKVILPCEGQNIGIRSFEKCRDLTDIDFPSCLQKIDDFAFNGCSGIKVLNFPSSMTSVGWGAFSNCSSLETVFYPDSLTDIDGFVFMNDTQLRYLYGNSSSLDGRCLIINHELIWFAPKDITSYRLPDDVTTLRAGCFSGYNSIKKISLPSKLSNIRRGAFWGTGITEITIPSSTCIGYEAFSYCANLHTVIFEEGWNCASSRSFNKCNKLKRLYFPLSITRFPKDFADDCKNLSFVFIPNTKDKVKMESDAFPATTRVIFKSPSDVSVEQTIPPILTIKKNSLKVNTPLGDGEIGSGSNCIITAQVSNEGERVAQKFIVKVTTEGTDRGVIIDSSIEYSLNPGETKNITIPFRTTYDTGNGEVTFSLFLSEQNGYNSDVVSVTAPIYAHGTNNPQDISSEGLKYIKAGYALAEVAKNADELFPVIAEYKKAIVSDPDFAPAFYDIAKIYTTLGKEKDKKYFKEAIIYYTKYKHLIPEESASIDAEIYAIESLMK